MWIDKKLFRGNIQLYEIRDFWAEMHISRVIVVRRFNEILGVDEQHFRNVDESIEYLTPIIDLLQRKMVNYIEKYNSKIVATEISKAFDKCFRLYMKEKDERKSLADQNIVDSEVRDVYESNRNIAMNIIASSNIWLENSVLLQKAFDKEHVQNTDDAINPIFMLSLSKNNDNCSLYYGLDINPEATNPIMVYREHPVIYHSPLLTGNQQAFTVNREDYLAADDSSFGIGFFNQYGVPFIESLRVFSSFQKYELRNG